MKKRIAFLLIVTALLCIAACASAYELKLPAGVKTIEAEAYYGDTSITRVIINNKCTTIQDRAFYGCTNLRIVDIPNSVKKIGSYVFRGCNQVLILCRKNRGRFQ